MGALFSELWGDAVTWFGALSWLEIGAIAIGALLLILLLVYLRWIMRGIRDVILRLGEQDREVVFSTIWRSYMLFAIVGAAYIFIELYDDVLAGPQPGQMLELTLLALTGPECNLLRDREDEHGQTGKAGVFAGV